MKKRAAKKLLELQKPIPVETFRDRIAAVKKTMERLKPKGESK